MAHIDPASGQWVADADGPAPAVPDTGSIGQQTNPTLPPIQPQPVPPPPQNVVKIDEPFQIDAKPEPPAPAPKPSPAPSPPSLASNFGLSGSNAGMLSPGNIDLTKRPVVHNPDGSISTVRSASFNFDGKEVLLPTVSPDGRILSDDEAVALYKRTGQNLGTFATPDAATQYAKSLHEQQAGMYLPGSGSEGPQKAPGAPPAPVPVLPQVTPAPGARPQLVTSQKLTSPEQVDALKNVDQANAAIRDNTVKAGDLKVDQATGASQFAANTQSVIQAAADARAARAAAFEKQQATDNANIAKAQADGLKDPDAGESWTHRLLRALAIGLGQYSAAMNHTDNMAAHIFEQDRKESLQRQKDKITAAKESGKLDADQYRQSMAAIDAKEVGQIAAFKAKWEAESKRLGIPQARIDADANTLALDKQEAEARAKLLNEDRVTVRDETPKEMKAGKGGGGGGALAKFVEGAGALGPGDPIPPDLAVIGLRAGLKPNQIAAEVDRYRGSGAKSAAAEAKANGAGAGGIGSVRQNAVLGNLAEAERAAKDITPGGVSMDTIRQLQTNEEQAKAGEHSASSGVLGNLLTRAGRSAGVVARGRYEGIPEDQQKKITAAEQVITHLTEMQQGKNIETLEQYRDRYSPYVPGLSEQEVRRREKALPGLVAEQRAIQDPKGVGRQRQQAAETDPRIEAAKAVAADPARFNRLNPVQKAAILKAARSKSSAPADNGGNPNDDITL